MPLIELNGTSAGVAVNGSGLERQQQHDPRLGDQSTSPATGSSCPAIPTPSWATTSGTDATGTLDRGNARDGIEINGANNTIGGTTASERNLLSGNTEAGIYIHGACATSNVVQGNYIGINAAGTAGVGNTLSGIVITDPGASANTIGGTAAGAGNVISGNPDSGIAIGYNTGSGNVVQGNYIGTNAAGTAGIANGIGIQIIDASNDDRRHRGRRRQRDRVQHH